MKRVVQDDSLLKENKLARKQADRVRSESERFRFENRGKPLDVKFRYWFSLRLKRTELVGSCIVIFSKHVDKKKMEECIKNALEHL